jgi:hypothetical protein
MYANGMRPVVIVVEGHCGQRGRRHGRSCRDVVFVNIATLCFSKARWIRQF